MQYGKGLQKLTKFLHLADCPPVISSSLIECLDSNLDKNLKAYALGFHLFSSPCYMTVPKLCLLASHMILKVIFRLKCVNCATFFTFWFALSKALYCSSVQCHIASFFRIDLNGKHIDARSGINLLN